MKVRYNGGDESVDSGGWLTQHNIYQVLELSGSGDRINYRIMDDEGWTPAIYPSDLFEIVSNNIPENWVFIIDSNVEWSLTPAPFANDGYWEAYFDRDPRAVAKMREVMAALSEQE